MLCARRLNLFGAAAHGHWSCNCGSGVPKTTAKPLRHALGHWVQRNCGPGVQVKQFGRAGQTPQNFAREAIANVQLRKG